MKLEVLRLQSGNNIAFESETGVMTLEPTTIHIDTNGQKAGFRFDGVNIPQGSEIHQAFIRLYGDGDTYTDVYSLMYVNHTDTGVYTTAVNDITNRANYLSGSTLAGSTGGDGAPFGVTFERGLQRQISNSDTWSYGGVVMVRMDWAQEAGSGFSSDTQFHGFAATEALRPELHILWEDGSQHENDAEVFIFDRAGNLIEQVVPELQPVSWKLNKYGKAIFRLGKEDVKLVQSTFTFGNRVLIRFANGLPIWGGVLETPRVWSRHHVEFTAYSAEYLLTQRVTGKTSSYVSATAGDIFRGLITEADKVADLDIFFGDIWNGGQLHTVSYHYNNVYNLINESVITRLEPDSDWDIVPEIVNNKLQFRANFYETKGQRLDGVLFQEGHNIATTPEPRLMEQGPIVNSWDLAGADISGETIDSWGDSRITSNAFDQPSINTYGFRSSAVVNPGIVLQATLDRNAVANLSNSKEPYNVYEFSVINKAPGLYADFRIGDEPRLSMPGYGFRGTNTYIRVLGMEYNPATRILSTIVRDKEDIA